MRYGGFTERPCCGAQRWKSFQPITQNFEGYAIIIPWQGQLSYFAYLMEYSCLKTLCAKRKTSTAKIIRKYKDGKGKWGIPYETKQGSKRLYFADYTDCKTTKTCDDNICSIAFVFQSKMVTFESRLKARTCELCGTTEAKHYEIHHVHKAKDLKGKEPWERVMIAKRRKTIVLCKSCHYEIHGRVLRD